MNEILSLQEMESRFPSEWVLIVDHKTNEDHEVLSGRVLAHSCNRDEVDRKLLELRPARFAFRYLGPLPEFMVMSL